VGQIAVVTSAGTQAFACSLDATHVFGSQVQLDELHGLLRARVESYTSGSGPMVGDRSSLFYVLFEVLNAARDPSSLPVVTPLLADPEAHVRERAARLLFALGEDEAQRPLVQSVAFPEPVLASLGDDVPAWLGQAPPPPPEEEPAVAVPAEAGKSRAAGR
jgi:hypothetical protein